MKLKAGLFALAAMFMAFALTGCYTQVAKTERNEEPPEYSDATNDQIQEEDAYQDYQHVTNVYVYDDFYARHYYWNRWDPWDPWYSWRYRYARSGWSVRFGYYDYDYWDLWCGTPWDRYYNPWWDNYYAWGPRWGWNYPYYDHYGNYPRSRGYVNEKRPFSRRSTQRDGDNGGAVSRRSSDRSSLSKPDENVYARGEDGAYRRTRRTVTDSPRDTRTDAINPVSDDRRSARRGATTDSRTDDVVRMPNSGNSSVAQPASPRETPKEAQQPSSSTERRSSKRKSSEDNKVSRRPSNVDRPSSSSSRGSRGSSVSTPRRSSSSGASRGSSSSGVSRSGSSSSGSSSKGSSSSSSGTKQSSGSSNRRTKN